MKNDTQTITTDDKLWQLFKSGEKVAFGRIYHAHVRSLFGHGYKLTADVSLVEDCIHDLFMELWRRRKHLSDITCIRLYLVRALDRKLKRRMIQHRKQKQNMSSVTTLAEMPLEFNWISEQTAAENMRKLHRAMQTLSYRQREVLTLHFFEGRDYNEIAKVINIKYQSVANLMCQSLQKLRKGMEFKSHQNDIH